MTLHQLLNSLGDRFEVNPELLDEFHITVGFVTPDESYSIKFSSDGFRLEAGLKEASLLLRGTLNDFEKLFASETAGRAQMLTQIKIVPDVPWNARIISDLMQALNLETGESTTEHQRFDGPFPLPLRYPASENVFKFKMYRPKPVAAYDPDKLPALVADDHPDWVTMYNKAWEIGFGNLRQPEPESGFIANYIDTAFNDNTFMWDSCFMMMFGRYAQRVFHFMGTLENFYAKQHDDGFICREISTYSGTDLFMALDPSSSGPPIMAWAEWQYYQLSKDLDRLRAVFPVLVAYHRWWKDWRTWPDDSYFTTGWGSGMDNQSRVPDSTKYHHHYSWVDINMQQAMDCQMLLDMAQAIGRDEFSAELHAEYAHLRDYVNVNMWDEATGFYYDRSPQGQLSSVKSIGVYWGLLSDILPPQRRERLIDHLKNPTMFNRPHRVPSQSADHADYRADGGYWLGGVWSPTNYMVLRGLTRHGQNDLAYDIARNHVENVAQVFQDTGTLWENYAPEYAAPGEPARANFVGWTGVSAITIPLEYLVGLRPQPDGETLVWDIRLTERHGALHYPLGLTNLIDLACQARSGDSDRPRLNITAKEAFRLEVHFADEIRTFDLVAGTHHLTC